MLHVSDINKFPLTKGQAPLPLLFVWGFRWGREMGLLICRGCKNGLHNSAGFSPHPGGRLWPC